MDYISANDTRSLFIVIALADSDTRISVTRL